VVAVVSVPTVDGGGLRGNTDILLGPTTQIMSAPYPIDLPELEDADAVREITAKQELLLAPRHVGATHGSDGLDAWEHPGV
jgi:hypothetical protein